jgi:DNA-binding response OmpR family regulator
MTGDDQIAVLCVATGRETDPAQGLTATGTEIRTEYVPTPEEALRAFDQLAYDCILLGDRGDTDIRATVERLTGSHPDVPVLLYGVGGDLSAYLDAGATDIVRADPCQSDVLLARIRNVVEQ